MPYSKTVLLIIMPFSKTVFFFTSIIRIIYSKMIKTFLEGVIFLPHRNVFFFIEGLTSLPCRPLECVDFTIAPASARTSKEI